MLQRRLQAGRGRGIKKAAKNKLADRNTYISPNIQTIKDQIAALEAQLDNEVLLEKGKAQAAIFYGKFVHSAANITDWKTRSKGKKQNKALDANGVEIICPT